VRRAWSAGIGFIRLTPSFSVSSPLLTFTKGDDAPLLPQEGWNRLIPHLAVHRAFEKYRRDDLSPGESRRGHKCARASGA
jgi:hypothetical protein